MRKFIVAVALFALIVLGTVGGFCVAEIWAEIAHYRKELKAPVGATVFVCGDSRTEVGLNPELWPELFNFSLSGRPFDQTYLTALDILEANPGKMRTMLIDVSPEGMGHDYGASVGAMPNGKCLLLYFLHWRDQLRDMTGVCGLFRDIMVERRLKLLRRVARGRKRFSSSLVAGYQPMKGNWKSSNPTAYRKRIAYIGQLTRGALSDRSSCANYYKLLERTIDMARERGLEVVLLTAPWHADQVQEAGADRLRKFAEGVADFAAAHGCRYLDLSTMQLADECWRDANHVNVQGAVAFTEAVRAFVRESR